MARTFGAGTDDLVVQGWVHVEIPSSAQVQLLEAVTAAGIPGVHIEGTTSRDDAKTVIVSVTSRAGTAKETAALNTDRIQKLLEVVKASTPEAKITSEPLAQFHPPQNLERDVGQSGAGSEHAYTAQNELLFHLASVAPVAEVVDEAKALGAGHLESVTFDLRNPSGAQTEAVRGATVEA